jgi:hypothetical protein
MGLTWAIPWGIVIGITGALLISLLPSFPPSVSRWAVAIQTALNNGFTGAVMGFATGGVFSIVLMAAERRRELQVLKKARFALWGAVAGAISSLAVVLPALAGGYGGLAGAAAFMGITAGLGAGSAAASLAIARSGMPLEGGQDPESRPKLPRSSGG